MTYGRGHRSGDEGALFRTKGHQYVSKGHVTNVNNMVINKGSNYGRGNRRHWRRGSETN
jgi:hypothetical protein